jgi:tetratricopeptide (TPR) repeat protein
MPSPEEPPRARGRPPLVPPTPREPIGRDAVIGGPQASRPPRRRAAQTSQGRQERPELPEDTIIELPVRMRKEIDRTISPPARARDVKISLHLGSLAVDEEDLETALRYLRWAKHLAPRYGAVREALGIALYRAGEMSAALAELQTYRRLSGSNDQNHLIADCMRAGGREIERAIDVALELVDDERVDSDRRIEAVIVAAAVQEEVGQAASARRLVDRALSGLTGQHSPSPEARVRLLWFAAELAHRAGSSSSAKQHLAELLTLDPGYPDASERLAELNRAG